MVAKPFLNPAPFDKSPPLIRIAAMFTPTQKTKRVERDQLSILLAVTLLNATLFRFVELPTFTWATQRILGSPLKFSFDGDWMLVILMVGLVATGSLSIMQRHPLRQSQERPLLFSLITPTVGAFLISLLLIRATTWSVWLVTLIMGSVLIGALIQLSHRAFSTQNRGYATARTLLNIFDYLLGFVILSLMLQDQSRALITAPTVFILCGALALELLSATAADTSPVLLYSGIIALLLSEFAWVLGYWPISAWTAATLLILGLYLLNGIIYQLLLKRLTRHVIIEFGSVALLMFILALWIRP